MTETVPERAWPAKVSLLREHQDEILDYMCVNEFVTTDDPTGNYVLETALEAAQSRIVELQDKVLHAYNLAKKAEDFRKTARREALEAAAKVAERDAHYKHGDRIAAAIRALMEDGKDG